MQGYSCDALCEFASRRCLPEGHLGLKEWKATVDVCEKAVYSSVQPSTYVVPAIGDNYQGGVIVDVDVRKYIAIS